jgi:peptide/nickel transport system ATP-binding protein
VEFTRRTFSSTATVRAVDGIDLTVIESEVLGLVGESGCGKSTMARVLLRLVKATSGSVKYLGRDIFELKGEELKTYRRNVQMIFQDPYESLNPRWTTFDTLTVPIRTHRLAADDGEMLSMAKEALDLVELSAQDVLRKYPHQLSGGMRQRVNIARALVIQPKLIVADEPVSMLDVSIRAEVMNLLIRLKKDRKLTYLFITHDLAVARYMCDRIAVMYLGKIVEVAPTEELVRIPHHPYTQLLLRSSPRLVSHRTIDVITGSEEVPYSGSEVPSATDIPRGCRFHPRCPFADELCKQHEPALVELSDEHFVSCHHPQQI